MDLAEHNIPDTEEVISRVTEDIFLYGKATFERQIPSAYDGLKPVARRILYVCWENNINKFTKVTKLGGAVAGYHPHGDSSINAAIIKLAQGGTTMAHSLLAGEGSFGTISSMVAAAPRYIAAKVSDFGKDAVVSQIERQTMEMMEAEADFGDKEPVFLPTRIPLLLINGATGIAESYTSNIPPHNLGEIADRVVKFIRNKEITAKALSKGLYPDYVLGGSIINCDSIHQSYYDTEYSNPITVRGEAEIDQKNNQILVRALPHSFQNAFDFESFIGRVKSIMIDKDTKGNVKNVILSGITYIGEKVDTKGGVPYIYISCKNGSNLVEILENLYKVTNLQLNNSFNLTINKDGLIKKSTIKNIIEEWYNANYMIRRRRIIYRINALQNKLHRLQGVLKVYPFIDDVISIIKKSKGRKDETIAKLRNKFKISLIQAKSIAETQLIYLTLREEKELKASIKKVFTDITNYEKDLDNIDNIMIKDVLELKRNHGRPRRTALVSRLEERTDIVISTGAILASRNNYGIFDASNIVSGKKILNGLKGVRIDGEWVKEIVDSKHIDANIDSILTFYANGSANVVKPVSSNSWINNSKYCDDNGYIVTTSPIYSDVKGTIITVDSEGFVKRFDPSTFTSRPVSVGNIVSCEFIPESEENSSILLVDKNFRYINFKVSDIVVKNRSSKGYQTSFKKGSGLSLLKIKPDSDPTHLTLLMKNNTDKSGNVFTIPIADVKSVNRTNKPKLLTELRGYTCTGISSVNLRVKEQIGIFIGTDRTFDLRINNIRNLKGPRKLSTESMDFIGIEL